MSKKPRINHPIESWPLDPAFISHDYISTEELKLEPLTLATNLKHRTLVAWEEPSVLTEMLIFNNNQIYFGCSYDKSRIKRTGIKFIDSTELNGKKFGTFSDVTISKNIKALQNDVPPFIKLPYPTNFRFSFAMLLEIQDIKFLNKNIEVVYIGGLQRYQTFDNWFTNNHYHNQELINATVPPLNVYLKNTNIGFVSMWVDLACGFAKARGFGGVLVEDGARTFAGDHAINLRITRFLQGKDSVYVNNRNYYQMRGYGGYDYDKVWTKSSIRFMNNALRSVFWKDCLSSSNVEINLFTKKYNKCRQIWLRKQGNLPFPYSDPLYVPDRFIDACNCYLYMLPYIPLEPFLENYHAFDIMCTAITKIYTLIKFANDGLENDFREFFEEGFLGYRYFSSVIYFIVLNPKEKTLFVRTTPDNYEDI